MTVKFDPIWVFLSALAISSFGGVAAKLRSKEAVTCKTLIAAFLYSGVVGLCVCLTLYSYFDARNNIPLLLGISGLAGIGGANIVDLVYLILGGKIKLVFTAIPAPELTEQHDTGETEEDK